MKPLILLVGRGEPSTVYLLYSHIAHVLYDLYAYTIRYIFPFREKTQEIQQKKKKKGNTTPRGGRCLFYKRCIQSATVSILRFSVYWTLRARTTHIAGCRHGYKHKHLYTLCRHRRRVLRSHIICGAPCLYALYPAILRPQHGSSIIVVLHI